MQRRPLAVLSLAVLTAAALAGCTSGDSDEQTTTAGPTTEGAAPEHEGWFCRLIEDDAVNAATGGRADVAREVEALSTEDEFQCDVLVPTEDGGSEVAMSLSMHRNIPGLADELLGEVMGIEGAVAGPEHLGVSYIADTLAVSVVPCNPRGVEQDDAEIPYVFVMRAQLDTEGNATDMLDDSLTRLVRETDQNYGCSPSKIHPKDPGATAPADDAGVTTAP
ncbi:hypothetical protein MWU75_16285 [Ornithinimicrobium sp. F0845]|uniref:hypothetical protein n=1 Tax=Ornithinimicrobium sp. F0845 TaxID=2926412 RepID=UPI001FF30A0E|nr:hypothetical protein [Ornithinimicrobium sp. F0845]MCK0113707.1 hypothetical protein [Ornithinimicrobium sp. F0845]